MGKVDEPTIIVRETQAVAREVGVILKDFPHLIKGKTEDEADPYLVAHGHVHGYVVVTEEKPSANPKSKPKIPDVCNAYSVAWLNTVTMLRQLNIKL